MATGNRKSKDTRPARKRYWDNTAPKVIARKKANSKDNAPKPVSVSYSHHDGTPFDGKSLRANHTSKRAARKYAKANKVKVRNSVSASV